MSTPPNNINSQYLSSWPQQAIEMAQIAYELTSEKWPLIGQGSFHPTIANIQEYNDIVEEIANRIVAVLTIRLVALLTCRLGNQFCGQQSKIYSDYSTTTICKAVLTQHHSKQLAATPNRVSYHPSRVCCNGIGSTSTKQSPPFPAALDPAIIQQLRTYTLSICKGYHSSDDVPYHNVEHAYHVFLSANKLLDLMLCEEDEGGTELGQAKKRRTTYGIKFDPLAQLAFLFSALIHDVDHTGINNRQLVLESDDLAVLYNDQSVAEQNSLAVAFTTLKEPQYAGLREVMFKTLQDNGNTDIHPVLNSEDFFRFRKLVIDLVLATDIASPERTQIVKSKWKEAFGEALHISEENKKYTAENNNVKNVNFEPEVIFKEQQKLSGDSHRSLSESITSALSAETYLSDSGSSGISTTEDDDFNLSSASSKKMNFDENDNGSGSAKSNKSDISGRPRRRTGTSSNLSASATVPKSRLSVPARPAGFSRSMLSTSSELKNFRHVNNRRLGVRRALDLAGSTIEAVSSLRIRQDLNVDDLEDDADEFKATACLEQMLRGADVSALMQNFENVRKWSTKLYKELNNGFCSNRGEDPKIGWFDNQIKFFDFYILPLAKNLRVMVRMMFFRKLYVIFSFSYFTCSYC